MIAWAAVSAVLLSAMMLRTKSGKGISGLTWRDTTPAIPWITGSSTGRSAYGPVGPYPLIET